MIFLCYLFSVVLYYACVLGHDAFSVYVYNKTAKKRVYFKKLKTFDVWKSYTRIQRFLVIAIAFIPFVNLFVIGMLISGLIDDHRQRNRSH